MGKPFIKMPFNSVNYFLWNVEFSSKIFFTKRRSMKDCQHLEEIPLFSYIPTVKILYDKFQVYCNVPTSFV